MRVVLDTNVLVSGLLNPYGPPGRIADLVLTEHLRPLFDDRIMAEYRDVLARPKFGFRTADLHDFLRQLEAVGEAVIPTPLAVDLPDQDDLPFLEVAAAGLARALVTGNVRHFTPRRGTHQVKVVSPNEFLKKLKREAP
ncbi:MAG: putative toxin-antitoxin system toxin component, PIN family [Gemmatimonadota bacterium]